MISCCPVEDFLVNETMNLAGIHQWATIETQARGQASIHSYWLVKL